MKKTFTFLSCFIVMIFCSVTVKAQWNLIDNPFYPSQAVLESAQFFGTDTGFVSCEGGFIYTTDGGNTWSKISVEGVRDVNFCNSTTGYLAGVVGESIKKTIDGGQTWTALTPPTSNSLWGVSDPSVDTAYVCGTGGVIWKTTDGGASFGVVSTSSEDLMQDIFFTSNTRGCVLDQLGVIYETKNGGASWTAVYTNSNVIFTHLYFVTADVGFAVGGNGFIIKTSDGGDTWTPLTTNSKEWLMDVQFCDVNNGMAVGYNGTVLRTTDGGTTWFNDNIPVATILDCCWLLSPTSAIVTGDSGVVYKNINLTASINNVQKQQANVKVFPNPFSGSITFSYNAPINTPDYIKVYNIMGSLVYDSVLSGNSFVLNDAILTPGGYYYTLSKNGIQIYSGKISKM